MDLKIQQAQALVQTQARTEVNQNDDTFKFTLISNIEEADLQERLKVLMGQINDQGEKIARLICDVKEKYDNPPVNAKELSVDCYSFLMNFVDGTYGSD